MDMQYLSEVVSSKVHKIIENGFSLEQISDLCVRDENNHKLALVDVVFEGGGAKGIGLVGAMYALEKLGLRWRKVGGTSAGSILAALLVCNNRNFLDEKSGDILQLVTKLDFLEFLDGGSDADYLMSHLGSTTEGKSKSFKKFLGLLRNLDDINRDLGINPGQNLRPVLQKFMASEFSGSETKLGTLENLWEQQAKKAHLLNPHFSSEDLRPEFQAVSFDITNHRKATLPRDIDKYAYDKSVINLLDIVRASMSIPFVFEPAEMVTIVGGPDNLKGSFNSLLVDGGLVENFPIRMFDTVKPKGICCPTIGILIDEEDKPEQPQEINSPSQLAVNLIKGLIVVVN